MGNVKILSRKHYSGVDADRASLVGVLGDTYAANDSGKFYYWNDNLSSWKTGLGYEYVERLVDTTPDKTLANFTTDANWKVNLLDLSGLVPAGAVAVKLKVTVNDDAANSLFLIRRDAVNGGNLIESVTYVANIPSTRVEDVAIESDRLLDYYGSNLLFSSIDVTVLGWYI